MGDAWQVVVCDDTSGDIFGAGVLLSNRYVLTCAHVVQNAGGAPVTGPGDPGPGLRVDSVLCSPRWSRAARVVPGCWVSKSDSQRGDLALLELGAPVTCHPGARLRQAPAQEVLVRMRGFPDGDRTGVAAEGRLVGATKDQEWVEIHAQGDDRAPWVSHGFSGAGVADKANGDVIGIIMSVRKAAAAVAVAAYMMPVHTIVRYLPLVEELASGGGAARAGGAAGVVPPGGAAAAAALRQEIGRLLTGVWSGTAVVTGCDPSTPTPWLARLAGGSSPGGWPPAPDAESARVPPGAVPGAGAAVLMVDAAGQDTEWIRRRIAARFRLPADGDCVALVSGLLRLQPRPALVIDRVDVARDVPGLIADLVEPLAERARRRGVRLVLGFTREPPAGLRYEISLGPEPLTGTARAAPWPDLVRRAIAELADAEQRLATRYAEVSARVAGACVPPPGIAARLRVRFAVATPGSPELALIGERAEAALAGVAGCDARLDELRRSYDRLRAMLRLYGKQAGQRSGAGDRRAGELYAMARETLTARPCDLNAAQAAVGAYVDALRGRDGPGPGRRA